MEYPADLPEIIQYRTGKITRTSLCRRPVRYIGTSGCTDAALVCPRIPIGADAWRVQSSDQWRPLSELPEAWLPFLNRERGTEMDPRPKVKTR